MTLPPDCTIFVSASDRLTKSNVISREKKEGKVKIIVAFYSLSKGTVETVEL